MNNPEIPVGTIVHINPEDIKWECNGGDLISRRDIKDHIGELLLVYSGEELATAILNAIDNAPAVTPCDNCDLYFKATTKEIDRWYRKEVQKGGANNG